MAATFRYFAHPHQFSTYCEEPAQCELCGCSGPGYAGPFYGPRDLGFVCEECLARGMLVDIGVSTNQGDSAALRAQLREVQARLRDEEHEQLVRERTVELEHQTPYLVTWQDFFWPAHCGDYCRFIKEVGQPEIVRLSSDGNGPRFLVAHTPDIADMAHAMEVWEGVRPDTPLDGRVAYFLGVYLFQCLTCGEYVLLWDCD